jgi:transcription-repair coupling factor (superfamily II helicase)
MAGPDHITLGGAPEGFDAALVVAEVDKRGGPVVHIARDDKRMAAMADALAFFAPDLPVFRFPSWDCLPYDRVSPNADISATRMATRAVKAASASTSRAGTRWAAAFSVVSRTKRSGMSWTSAASVAMRVAEMSALGETRS